MAALSPGTQVAVDFLFHYPQGVVVTVAVQDGVPGTTSTFKEQDGEDQRQKEGFLFTSKGLTWQLHPMLLLS